MHHLCLGFPSSRSPGMDGWRLSVLPFLLLTLGRGLGVHHQDAAGQRTQTWGSGVSTQVAGCACWHTWKNFTSHTGKYVLVFGFDFFPPMQFSSAVSTHLQNPLEEPGSLFLLSAGLHNGWNLFLLSAAALAPLAEVWERVWHFQPHGGWIQLDLFSVFSFKIQDRLRNARDERFLP